MKLKKSFINKQVLEKNIKLYWPVWIIYTIILVYAGPIRMLGNFRTTRFLYKHDYDKMFIDDMSPAISMRFTIICIFIMAIVTGVILFNYLYNDKACNMIHSMPVTRKQLYCTNVLSGLLFMWVPLIVRFVVSLFICISNGVTDVSYLAIWLLASIGISFFAFGMVCVIMQLTGQLPAAVVLYAGFNILYYLIVEIFELVMSFMSYGRCVFEENINMMSPFFCCLEKVGFQSEVVETISLSYCSKYTFTGADTIVIYVLIAVILYLLAYILYSKRHLENVGNFMAVPFLRPVFRWGVGVITGLAGVVLIAEILLNLRISIGIVTRFIVALVVGLFAFVVAEMILKKNFQVITKKILKELCCFSVFMLAIYIGLFVYGRSIEKYIPKISEVESARVCIDRVIKLSGNDIQKVVDVQKKLIDLKSEYNEREYEYMNTVNIIYSLKDGSQVKRYYLVPEDIDLNEVCREVIELGKEPESTLYSIMESDNPNIVEGSVIQYGENDSIVIDKEIDAQIANEIYGALKKDAYAGNIQQYVVPNKNGDVDESYMYDLMITYEKNEELDMTCASTNLKYLYTVWIPVGPKCKNILAVLEKYELIELGDQLLMYE